MKVNLDRSQPGSGKEKKRNNNNKRRVQLYSAERSLFCHLKNADNINLRGVSMCICTSIKTFEYMTSGSKTATTIYIVRIESTVLITLYQPLIYSGLPRPDVISQLRRKMIFLRISVVERKNLGREGRALRTGSELTFLVRKGVDALFCDDNTYNHLKDRVYTIDIKYKPSDKSPVILIMRLVKNN